MLTRAQSGVINPLFTDIAQSSMNSGPLAGFQNRLINGNMAIAQRGVGPVALTASTALPTGSTGYTTVDRWFMASVGGTPTATQIAGTNQTRYRLKLSGANSTTAVYLGQRIAAENSYDMNGRVCTLSCDMSMSATLTTVTWAAYHATTTVDTFGTIAAPTKTLIATGSFNVDSTLSKKSVQITVPIAATKGIEILLTAGALTSGIDWVVGDVDFRIGPTAPTYAEHRGALDLLMCQAYFLYYNGLTSLTLFYRVTYSTEGIGLVFPVKMRYIPIALSSWVGTIYVDGSSTPIISLSGYNGSTETASFGFNTASQVQNAPCYASISSVVTFSAEIP